MKHSRIPRASAASSAGAPRGSKGITLVEVAVVGVLATIVMLAITGFYINSQGTWIEASSQAVTQREATLLLATIADSVRASHSAILTSPNGRLILRSASGAERCRFWLSSDGLVHTGRGEDDWGPLGTSTVTRFVLEVTPRYVRVDSLELRTAYGRLVQMSTLATFYN